MRLGLGGHKPVLVEECLHQNGLSLVGIGNTYAAEAYFMVQGCEELGNSL